MRAGSLRSAALEKKIEKAYLGLYVMLNLGNPLFIPSKTLKHFFVWFCFNLPEQKHTIAQRVNLRQIKN